MATLKNLACLVVVAAVCVAWARAGSSVILSTPYGPIEGVATATARSFKVRTRLGLGGGGGGGGST